jgi:hypothetical protein
VVDSTSVFYAKGAGHAGTLADKKYNVKIKYLTLKVPDKKKARSRFGRAFVQENVKLGGSQGLNSHANCKDPDVPKHNIP